MQFNNDFLASVNVIAEIDDTVGNFERASAPRCLFPGKLVPQRLGFKVLNSGILCFKIPVIKDFDKWFLFGDDY